MSGIRNFSAQLAISLVVLFTYGSYAPAQEDKTTITWSYCTVAGVLGTGDTYISAGGRGMLFGGLSARYQRFYGSGLTFRVNAMGGGSAKDRSRYTIGSTKGFSYNCGISAGYHLKSVSYDEGWVEFPGGRTVPVNGDTFWRTGPLIGVQLSNWPLPERGLTLGWQILLHDFWVDYPNRFFGVFSSHLVFLLEGELFFTETVGGRAGLELVFGLISIRAEYWHTEDSFGHDEYKKYEAILTKLGMVF